MLEKIIDFFIPIKYKLFFKKDFIRTKSYDYSIGKQIDYFERFNIKKNIIL